MTDREEVIKQLKKLKSFHNGSYGEAINFAIESIKVDMAYDLEYEKAESYCDDCISRQAVLEYIEGEEAELGHSSENELVRRDINELPSVIPLPKSGRWIDTGSGQECSECHEIQYGYDNFRRFCAYCGTRMVEKEE